MNAFVISAPARERKAVGDSWLKAVSPADRHSGRAIERAAEEWHRAGNAGPLELVVLEQLRSGFLRAVDETLRESFPASFPLPRDRSLKVEDSLRVLRQARDHYQAEGSEPAVLRALDLQVRVLRVQLLRQIDVADDDWALLLQLAQPVQGGAAGDVAMPDDCALLRDANARSLFVFPLLLQAAAPQRRTPAELELIERVARSYADKVSYRVDDDGRLRSNSHGPTVLTIPGHAIRFDTHRLIRRVVARQHQYEMGRSASELHLPGGLSRERATRVLGELLDCWGSGLPAEPLPRDSESQPTRWRVGVPAVRNLRAADAAAPSGAVGLAASPAAAGAYVYGRLEQDTIMRRVRGADQAGDKALNDYMRDGEAVMVVGRALGADKEVFSLRRIATGSIKLGALVALRAATEEAELRLGHIEMLAHSARVEADGTRTQRIGVHGWLEPARMVGLRQSDGDLFEDVFMLSQIRAGACDTVLVAPGRWSAGTTATLRLSDRDLRVVIGERVERGAGFERVEIRGLED